MCNTALDHFPCLEKQTIQYKVLYTLVYINILNYGKATDFYFTVLDDAQSKYNQEKLPTYVQFH